MPFGEEMEDVSALEGLGGDTGIDTGELRRGMGELL